MLTRLRRVRHNRATDITGDTSSDAGMTLVEVVVSSTLMSIAGAIALSFFLGMSTQTNRVTSQTLGAASARTAVNQMATVLRLADTPTNRPGYQTNRFLLPCGQTQLSSTDLLFFSNVASTDRSGTSVRTPPTLIELQLVGGVLTEYTYAPKSTAYGTGTYDWTTNYAFTYPYPSQCGQVANTPTSTTVLLTGVKNTNLFTYCSAATDVSTTCTATTSPDSIALVQLNVTMTPLRGNAAQTVQSGVAITGAVS